MDFSCLMVSCLSSASLGGKSLSCPYKLNLNHSNLQLLPAAGSVLLRSRDLYTRLHHFLQFNSARGGLYFFVKKNACVCVCVYPLLSLSFYYISSYYSRHPQRRKWVIGFGVQKPALHFRGSAILQGLGANFTLWWKTGSLARITIKFSITKTHWWHLRLHFLSRESF